MPATMARVSEAADAKIASFVREVLEERAIERFELRHVKGRRSALIRSFATHDREGKPREPGELAAKIDRVAATDAARLNGVQSYAVLAFEAGAHAYVDKTDFERHGDALGDALDADAVSLETVLAFQIKAVQHAYQLIAGQAGVQVQILQQMAKAHDEQMARKDARISELEKTRDETVVLREALLDRHHERVQDAKHDEAKERRLDMLVGDLRHQVPAIVSLGIEALARNVRATPPSVPSPPISPPPVPPAAPPTPPAPSSPPPPAPASSSRSSASSPPPATPDPVAERARAFFAGLPAEVADRIVAALPEEQRAAWIMLNAGACGIPLDAIDPDDEEPSP